MNDPQGYTAEYAALNHEIYSLTKQLEEKEIRKQINASPEPAAVR